MDKNIKLNSKIKSVENLDVSDNGNGILVNDRYIIYLPEGDCYDTKTGGDLPQYIFELRDEIIGKDDCFGEWIFQTITFKHRVFKYLDDLRASGETNMFGAGIYLQEEFGLGKREAREFLAKWMKQ
mgnify:CR=1 FL=1